MQLFPSIEEQTQIVRRVEELFTFADQIERCLGVVRNVYDDNIQL